MKKSWIYSALLAASLVAPAQAQQPAPADPAAAPTVMSCDPCCYQDDCCRRGRILADVGFLIVTPHLRDNPAGVRSLSEGIGGNNQVTVTNFEFNEQFAPRISLGAVGAGGFGGRINWFGFAISDTVVLPGSGNATEDATFTAAPLGVLDVNFTGDLTTHADLRMDVWDFEGVATREAGNWNILIAGGLRYAHITQHYFSTDPPPPGNATESILSGHNFNGAGPTVALEARRFVGQSPLYGYSNLRGAVLFGEAKHSVTRNGSNLISDAFAYNEEDVVIPVGEIEVGVGIRTEGRVSAFFQIGFNGQIWGEVGNSSRSNVTPIAGEPNWVPILTTPPPAVSVDQSNLGLIGFAVRTGLTY